MTLHQLLSALYSFIDHILSTFQDLKKSFGVIQEQAGDPSRSLFLDGAFKMSDRSFVT